MEISSRRIFSMPQPLQARRSLQARRPDRFKRGGRHIKRGSGVERFLAARAVRLLLVTVFV
jgi:hypothetical protein